MLEDAVNEFIHTAYTHSMPIYTYIYVKSFAETTIKVNFPTNIFDDEIISSENVNYNNEKEKCLLLHTLNNGLDNMFLNNYAF